MFTTEHSQSLCTLSLYAHLAYHTTCSLLCVECYTPLFHQLIFSAEMRELKACATHIYSYWLHDSNIKSLSNIHHVSQVWFMKGKNKHRASTYAVLSINNGCFTTLQIINKSLKVGLYRKTCIKSVTYNCLACFIHKRILLISMTSRCTWNVLGFDFVPVISNARYRMRMVSNYWNVSNYNYGTLFHVTESNWFVSIFQLWIMKREQWLTIC
jgi:hypothetical protein